MATFYLAAGPRKRAALCDAAVGGCVGTALRRRTLQYVQFSPWFIAPSRNKRSG